MEGLILCGPWTVNLLFGLAVVLWFWGRQEETLAIENKIKFTPRLFVDGTIERGTGPGRSARSVADMAIAFQRCDDPAHCLFHGSSSN